MVGEVAKAFEFGEGHGWMEEGLVQWGAWELSLGVEFDRGG